MNRFKEWIKTSWFWGTTLFSLMITYIWYLLTKNERLQTKVILTEQKESQRAFAERLAQKEKDSKNAQKEYDDLVAKYEAEHGKRGDDVQ